MMMSGPKTLTVMTARKPGLRLSAWRLALVVTLSACGSTHVPQASDPGAPNTSAPNTSAPNTTPQTTQRTAATVAGGGSPATDSAPRRPLGAAGAGATGAARCVPGQISVPGMTADPCRQDFPACVALQGH